MSFLKNFITGLLLLTVFLGSGAAEAKITSGSHGLADNVEGSLSRTDRDSIRRRLNWFQKKTRD